MPVQLFGFLVLLVFLMGWFLVVYILSKEESSVDIKNASAETTVNNIALAGVIISAMGTAVFYQYFHQFVV